MKLIVNKCNNGFTLSEEQKKLFSDTDVQSIPRHNDKLVASFEAGDRRGDGGSTLVLVDIPDDSSYFILNDNGYETVYWSETRINTI
jgi:hypothetical protein